VGLARRRLGLPMLSARYTRPVQCLWSSPPGMVCGSAVRLRESFHLMQNLGTTTSRQTTLHSLTGCHHLGPRDAAPAIPHALSPPAVGDRHGPSCAASVASLKLSP
jgi:hypothetical protein